MSRDGHVAADFEQELFEFEAKAAARFFNDIFPEFPDFPEQDRRLARRFVPNDFDDFIKEPIEAGGGGFGGEEVRFFSFLRDPMSGAVKIETSFDLADLPNPIIDQFERLYVEGLDRFNEQMADASEREGG